MKTKDTKAREEAAKADAAERREDYVNALKQEKAGLAGRDDDHGKARAKAVDAELARMKAPTARRTPQKEQTAEDGDKGGDEG